MGGTNNDNDNSKGRIIYFQYYFTAFKFTFHNSTYAILYEKMYQLSDN